MSGVTFTCAGCGVKYDPWKGHICSPPLSAQAVGDYPLTTCRSCGESFLAGGYHNCPGMKFDPGSTALPTHKITGNPPPPASYPQRYVRPGWQCPLCRTVHNPDTPSCYCTRARMEVTA